MTKWFFHQERGQTLGPLSVDDIKERIREGRIRLFDLVYREGEPGWRMALEHPDLRKEFKDVGEDVMSEKPWVCLQRKSETGFEFHTNGPFSTADIRQALQEGRINYNDFVWRMGFAEWRRIGATEDFNARVRTDAETKPAVSAVPPSAKDLLKDVVELKRPTVPPPASPVNPPEAVGEDLTKAAGSHGEPRPLAETKSVKVEPAASAVASVPAESEKPRRRSAWIDWAIVAGLVLLLGGVALWLPRYFRPEGDEVAAPPKGHRREVQPEAVAKFPPPTAPQEEPAKAEAKSEINPETKPEPREIQEPTKPEDIAAATETLAKEHAPAKVPARKIVKDSPPTELTLNVQTGANQVKIDLRTDGVGPYPVYLQIIGLPGQVGEGAAYYKFMKLMPKGDRKEPLDLSGLNLPQGRFVIRAETGDLKKEARVSVGTNDVQYKQNVARLRKTYAAAIWRERLELMKLNQILEKQITEVAAGKKFSAKGLEPLRAVKRSNGAAYLLYDQWYELREIFDEAKAGASPSLLGRLKIARDKIASFSVWK